MFSRHQSHDQDRFVQTSQTSRTWTNGNNPQRPSEEEAEVGDRNGEMEEGRGWLGTELRSYIHKSPAAVMLHLGPVYSWINKSTHHHHHSIAMRARYAAHVKFPEQGAGRLRREYYDSMAVLGGVAKGAEHQGMRGADHTTQT